MHSPLPTLNPVELFLKFAATKICFAIISFAVMVTPLVSANPFEYMVWKNTQGNEFEARIAWMPNEKEIVLQSKKGGKRYKIQRSTLLKESIELLDQMIDDTRTALINGNRLTGELIYKGIALNMRDETEGAARGKALSLQVNNFRINSNKNIATLELEGDIFATLRLDSKHEYFVKNDTLMSRSSVKRGMRSTTTNYGYDGYWWYYRRTTNRISRGTNPDSTEVASKGTIWTFNFSNQVRIKWDRVGVTDGPVISD